MNTKQPLKLTAIQPALRMADFAHNLHETLRLYHEAVARGAGIVVGPELGLFDYPALDLYVREDLQDRQNEAYAQLCAEIGQVPYVTSVVRTVTKNRGKSRYNMGVVIQNGREVFAQAKTCLADTYEYRERRIFTANKEQVRPFSLVLQGKRYVFGLLICEDVWSGSEGVDAVHERVPVQELASSGQHLDAVLVVNSSAYWWGKRKVRRELLGRVARTLNSPAVYANKVGGQDELVFDGGSLIVNTEGVVVGAGPHCESAVVLPGEGDRAYDDTGIGVLYDTLVCAVRDYAGKNGFRNAVLGLSGGIDSALTLAIAVDALGSEHVHAVMMPSPYTSHESLEDAEECAGLLGVTYDTVPIGQGMDAFDRMLSALFTGTHADVTEENIQARLRGIILMGLSNKFGSLVLTTGNKSEMGVGYATLYGDMAGGFAVLKDVYKTQVFALSEYRNSKGYVIPERIITKPPSAELRPDQKDTDSLPPYEVLDGILRLYVEEYLSEDAVVAQGYERAVVERVLRMVDRAEYKRRQAPPGPKVTERGLSSDSGRVVPITVHVQ
jgi:NAD+ synthase (glutamine-hydrolysing)